ncbi:MAG: hypothetical protein JST51_12475 [Armatimonadetes bacterium]|nr:hypothetical protein [Armatimonadota bacterium]
MIVSTLLMAAHLLSRQSVLNLPIIRFAGYDGEAYEFKLLRQQVEKIQEWAPGQGQELSGQSVAMTDGVNATAVFDVTYHPIAIVMARRQLAELFMRNGEHQYHLYELPQLLQNEIRDGIIGKHPKALVPDGLTLSFIIRFQTKLPEDTGSTMRFYGEPVTKFSTPSDESIVQAMDNMGGRFSGGTSGIRPTVKVYVEHPEAYARHAALIPSLLKMGDQWAKKELNDLNNRLFQYFEAQQTTGEYGKIFHSRDVNELSRADPKTFEELLQGIHASNSDDPQTADDVRRTFLHVQLQHSSQLTINYLIDGATDQIDLPGLND